MKNTEAANSYKFISLDFMKSYLITMRPYLLFVSGITGIAGLSCANNITILQTILIFIASFLTYGFGQALTDCFQIDTDSISSPYRPLTQGIITKKQVLSASITGLMLCAIIYTIYNPINLILGLIAALGLATYTPFKRKWWGGPFYNAWIVAVLCIIGFLSGSSDFGLIIEKPFIFVILSIFFGYANFVLTGYFKDIEADRKTGYNTLLVVFGRNVSSLVSDIFAGLQVFFTLYIIINYQNPLVNSLEFALILIFLITGIFLALLAQIRLHKVKTDEEAHAAIAPVVHSYILLASAIAANFKGEWIIPLIVFYICFILALKVRPAKNQI